MEKGWKPIKFDGNRRFYKLDFEIKQVKRWGKLFTIEELFKCLTPIDFPDNNKNNHKAIENIKSINTICVSDSAFGENRLVFPVSTVMNKHTGRRELYVWPIDIDGRWPSEKGRPDEKTIYPDDVYIRHLRMLNNGR